MQPVSSLKLPSVILVLTIGLAIASTAQSFAQPVPPAPQTPTSAATMMPTPNASTIPMPATETVPAATHNGEPIDALKNNPNGPTWLDKFARQPSDSMMPGGAMMPMKKSPMMRPDMMKSKKMQTMMKSKMMCPALMKTKMKSSSGHKPMGKM